jgi:hypothetical protein
VTPYRGNSSRKDTPAVEAEMRIRSGCRQNSKIATGATVFGNTNCCKEESVDTERRLGVCNFEPFDIEVTIRHRLTYSIMSAEHLGTAAVGEPDGVIEKSILDSAAS